MVSPSKGFVSLICLAKKMSAERINLGRLQVQTLTQRILKNYSVCDLVETSLPTSLKVQIPHEGMRKSCEKLNKSKANTTISFVAWSCKTSWVKLVSGLAWLSTSLAVLQLSW